MTTQNATYVDPVEHRMRKVFEEVGLAHLQNRLEETFITVKTEHLWDAAKAASLLCLETIVQIQNEHLRYHTERGSDNEVLQMHQGHIDGLNEQIQRIKTTPHRK